jgi:hypothetical protein
MGNQSGKPSAGQPPQPGGSGKPSQGAAGAYQPDYGGSQSFLSADPGANASYSDPTNWGGQLTQAYGAPPAPTTAPGLDATGQWDGKMTFSPQFGNIRSDDPRATQTPGYNPMAPPTPNIPQTMGGGLPSGNWGSMDTGDLVRQYSTMSNADPNFAEARAEIEQRAGGGDENAGKLIGQYNAGGTDFNYGASSNANTASQLNDKSPYMVQWRAQNPQWVAAAQKAISGG